MKMGGTGSKQEDQILTVGIEKATGTKFIYVPFKGGGEVAVQLVGKHVDSTVNNPIEAVAQWRAGKLRRPVRVRRKAHALQGQDHGHAVLGRHPHLQGSGRADGLHDAARHLHGSGRVKEQVDFYTNLLNEGPRNSRVEGLHGKGRLQPDDHVRRGYVQWLGKAENTHRELMKEAGFMAK